MKLFMVLIILGELYASAPIPGVPEEICERQADQLALWAKEALKAKPIKMKGYKVTHEDIKLYCVYMHDEPKVTGFWAK